MWAEWKQHDYAQALLFVLQRKMPWLTIDDIFKPPDQVMSWAFRADDSVKPLDFEGNRVDAD
jgi:hypothetical protein